MKERANGKETKKNILREAKRLFYENSFSSTTYEDICRAVGINAGTLYYHYSTKAVIANLIFEDFFDNNYRCLHRIFQGELDSLTYAAVEIRSYLKLLFMDKKFLRFFADIYQERIPNKLALKNIEAFYRRIVDEFGICLDEVELLSLVIVAVGYQCEFVLNYRDGYLNFPPGILEEQYIQMRFQVARIPEKAIENAIVGSKKAMEHLDISLDPYFVPVYKDTKKNQHKDKNRTEQEA